MSTYDGAYSRDNHENGAKVCSCREENVNVFCCFHGKYNDGSFKHSKEYEELKSKLSVK